MFSIKDIVKHKQWLKEGNLGEIDIAVVQHCNLNCASCDHFSPLAKEEYIDIGNYEKLLARLKYILHDKKVYRFNLMGGEPLLHPKLFELCKITREYFPQSGIFITTNGILLKERNEEVQRIKKELNVRVLQSIHNKNCSFYKLNLHNNKTENVENLCCNNRETNVLKIQKNVDEKFWDFYSDFPCAQLNENGDYFSCIIPANIRHLNSFFDETFEVIEGKDYVNIYKIDTIEPLLKMNCQPTISFCKYCGKKSLVEWSMSKYDKSEWIY